MNHNDYLDSGFRIFGLYGADKDGACLCGNPNCKAAFKHPRSSNWQHTPHWSDEQLDIMDEMGQFDTGFGVLCDDHIIIDIDPRNGGKLEDFKEYYDLAGFVVSTGGGGWHIYFSKPPCAALVSHLPQFEGIDFKSSGYVVGCGSVHASGATYESAKGHPDDITEAPEKLLQLLEKKGAHRASVDGIITDVTDSELSAMLKCINPDSGYDTWYKIGMAVHHSTNGEGFTLWDDWSSKGAEYNAEEMDKKWHSFGKSSNPVTLGTLLHYAKEGGYQEPVTFETDLQIIPNDSDEIDISGIDLLRPPSFVGEVTKWVRSTSDKPTDNIAVASGLSIVSAACGLNYISDDPRPAYGNIFCFCVAGSGVGKQSMLNAVRKAMIQIGYVKAIASGDFKSQQAIVRRMIDNQMVIYLMDEIGLELSKVTGTSNADYLQGVTKNLMSAFSSSDDIYSVEGEALKVAITDVSNSIAASNKIIENNEDKSGIHAELVDQMTKQKDSLEKNGGIENPYVGIIGYTTGETFDHLVSGHNVKQGFFTRSLIFREKETVPMYREDFTGAPDMPEDIKNTLLSLATNGSASVIQGRIENYNERKKIPTTDDGKELLKQCRLMFHNKAVAAKESGLESIFVRAHELVLKVSLILAVGEGVRTREHILWAYALICRDLEDKENVAAGNIAEEVNQFGEAISRKIIDQLGKKDHEGETTGVIVNRIRSKKYNAESIKQALEHLSANGIIKSKSATSKRAGKTERWFLA